MYLPYVYDMYTYAHLCKPRATKRIELSSDQFFFYFSSILFLL